MSTSIVVVTEAARSCKSAATRSTISATSTASEAIARSRDSIFERSRDLDELLQARGVALDDPGGSARASFLVVRGHDEERLGGQDRAHRRSQLVRRVRDEVAPHRLEPAQIGHVVEHEQQAAGAHTERLGAH
ncbi:MAG: hypothetical protein U0271_02310 [Polyangiaceae bacterium]